MEVGVHTGTHLHLHSAALLHRPARPTLPCPCKIQLVQRVGVPACTLEGFWALQDGNTCARWFCMRALPLSSRSNGS